MHRSKRAASRFHQVSSCSFIFITALFTCLAIFIPDQVAAEAHSRHYSEMAAILSIRDGGGEERQREKVTVRGEARSRL